MRVTICAATAAVCLMTLASCSAGDETAEPSSTDSTSVVASPATTVEETSAEGGSEVDGVTEVSEPTGPAATLVTNARVFTADLGRSWAEAFAYDANGTIIAVGGVDSVTSAAEAAADGDLVTLDADGAMVVPGFQDAHVHVPEAGLNAEVCFTPDGLTLEEYEEVLVECAADQPDSQWVRAAGASLFDLREDDPDGESPLDVLDRAVPDRPALVLDNLGHAVWTNSLGLEAAGIGDEDPDPQGGVFHRNESGDLTGLLLEDAQQLVRNAAATDDETNYQALLLALDQLAESGVTTISDAGGYWAQNHPAAFERALAEGTLTVRAANSLYLYPDLDPDEQLAEFERRLSADPDSLLRFDTAKVYVDGILDLGTAWMIDPYDVPVDPNYPSGFQYFTDEQLTTYVNALHQIGYRISFHAIGDAAVRDALDAVEEIDADWDEIAGRRHRTTHTYLVAPDDLGRFAELGVSADLQQSADAVATQYHDELAEIIGRQAYDLIPTGDLLDAGATVSLSSDWDAGPLPPLGTIERSLTRDRNAMPDLETALLASTIEAAYVLGHDRVTGSIEPGKQADFVMLADDLFEVDTDDIDETEVLLTVVGGREVFRSGSFSG